jgi:hypothetical protein
MNEWMKMDKKVSVFEFKMNVKKNIFFGSPFLDNRSKFQDQWSSGQGFWFCRG